jgi:hypothetical protein
MNVPAAEFGPPHVAISPDGRTAAAAYGRTVFGLWEVASSSERRQFRPQGVTAPVALSPDGRIVAYCTSDTSDTDPLHLLDVVTGTELARYDGHLGRVRAIAFSPDGRSVVTGSADTTALVWPVPPPPALPTDVNLDACWADLAEADAAKAYAAHWHLSAMPQTSVPFLRDRLHLAAPLDPARREEVVRAIADLDSPQFAARQKAVQRLGQFGERAVPLLKEALAKQPSAEARRHLEQLLNRADIPLTSGDELRALRAVEVLERIATTEAQQVLQRLADGRPSARLTREAKAALDRLERQAARR